ncbi:SGNH hydrolase [Coniochaeta ligniaria NRRL 30616]|uniref:SGNH hydrolase n=1 Tax=Coniochaeta ligniaria NRRL 30616 TaxID=1408157 RepID=A0A1J7J629_9PEZI|nr:SGNH hydrolase [Coniochaeta ligniaria NRRL 30616]
MRTASVLSSAVTALLLAASPATAKCYDHWVQIWGTMPQLVEPANLPNPPFNGTNVVFQNATLRQTIYVTQPASTIRLQISNAFGASDLPITAVTLALPPNNTSGSSSIIPTTLVPVTFSSLPTFTIPNGAVLFSDPIPFPVVAGQILSVSIYLSTGQTTNFITGHPGSRTTSYMVPGNHLATTNLSTVPGVANVDHWYFLSGVDAYLPAKTSALVVVGDSITDGRGSTTNANDRWPDQLLARMRASDSPSAAKSVAVVNQAAGGNRVLADGLGPNALGRIDRDVIAQSGARYMLIFEGVNDIGVADPDAATQTAVADRLIAAFTQMVVRVHRFGIVAIGATITPFCGPGQTYSDPERERSRQRVNEWIRSSGVFDAVVDFDEAVRDPGNGTMLNPAYNSGDWLHLNPEGYGVMARAVDLEVFGRFASGVHGEL